MVNKVENESKMKLRNLLKELFQFENADLDFGIYRIMNFKKEQIAKFIDKDLIEEIAKQLNLLAEEEKQALRKDIGDLKRKIQEAFGEDAFKGEELRDEFKATPLGKKYEEKRQELERVRVSEGLERDVYNHIYSFFSRYYDNGDFLCKRRYAKKSRYVVPYNGEETLLYWANKDQYYVKSSEYFRKFSFKVGDLKVNFRVAEVGEETGNLKAEEKKFFVLNQEKIWDFNDSKNEMNIYFDFRSLSDAEKEKFGERVRQEDLNKFILEIIAKELANQRKFQSLFEKQGEKTIFEMQLNKYTKRNTMDYFIHKDLKGFLEQELDFYIKNEVLNLEDMETIDKEKLGIYLLEAQVIRNISLKIIDFLAHIENFQKKIWKKKKFIIRTDYVITLNKIKEYAGKEFLESIVDEIMKNGKQLEEWKNLLKVELKSKKDLTEKLPLDTRHFGAEFKYKLLEKLSERNDLDKILNGILIKSENWQALNLILGKFREKIQCIYIDPPFNTGTNEFLYKNNYLDSCWVTMMYDRLEMGKKLLRPDGSIYVRIDYHGNHYVRMLMDSIFGKDKFRNEAIVNRTIRLKSEGKKFYTAQDSIFFYVKSDDYYFKDVRIEEPYEIEIKLAKNIDCKKLVEVLSASFVDCDVKIQKDRLLLRNQKWVEMHASSDSEDNPPRVFFGKEIPPPRKRRWMWNQEAIDRMIEKGWIRINPEIGLPEMLRTWRHVGSDWMDIKGYAQSWGFPTENSEELIQRILEASSKEGDWILDYFLGSGTTTAVAQKLGRKWIGVEMGEFFDNIPLRRMKIVLAGHRSGISKEIDYEGGGFFKYHYVEQYEDALENIEFEQKRLPEFEDYFIKYMLDFETKNSKTFLNIYEAEDPFNYKLSIIENCEPKVVNVDLVETFNYLIGLTVSQYKVLNNNERKYIFVCGEVDGKKALVVWRSIKDIDFEEDKKVISKAIADFNPEEIYVNGDCIVKGFKQIENEFKTLLFRD